MNDHNRKMAAALKEQHEALLAKDYHLADASLWGYSETDGAGYRMVYRPYCQPGRGAIIHTLENEHGHLFSVDTLEDANEGGH